MRCTSFYECSDVPTCKVGHSGAWEQFYPEDLQANCLRLESTLELLLRMELSSPLLCDLPTVVLHWVLRFLQ